MKRLLVVSAMLAVGLSAPAFADGYYSPNGFYLRGDVGGAFGGNTTLRDVNPNASNALLGPGNSLTGAIGNSVMVGGGIGYRISPAFRLDATLDWIPSLATGNSTVAMANGYLDLNGLVPGMADALHGFQPYVMAGAGISRNETDTLHTPHGSRLTGHTSNDFAWGAGVGVAYPLTPKLTLDLGYKYLDLGEARTGTTYTTASGHPFAVGALKSDLQVHTIMLGLRWSF